MFRLLLRMLPFALIAFGGLTAIGSVVTAIDPGPSEPTPATVREIEHDGAAGHRFVATSEGLLDWDGAVSVYEKQRSPGSIERTTDYFVPLVSLESERPQFAVFVRFTPEDFVEMFPGGAEAHGMSGPTAFDTRGVIETSNQFLPGPFRDYITSDLELPLDRVIVIKHGSRPASRGEAIVGTIVSLSMVLGGVLWLKSRARLRNAVLGEASHFDAEGGSRHDQGVSSAHSAA